MELIGILDADGVDFGLRLGIGRFAKRNEKFELSCPHCKDADYRNSFGILRFGCGLLDKLGVWFDCGSGFCQVDSKKPQRGRLSPAHSFGI